MTHINVIRFQFILQFRVIENEQQSFTEGKKKLHRKYNRLLRALEKEKCDLQFQLDSEQKGIHARKDSDVCFNVLNCK